MQLKASIDESDLGNIRDGQPVTFRVDAYPTRTVHAARCGRCGSIRSSSQNVVTYAAIVVGAEPGSSS